mgnify:FL=1
MKKTKVAPFCIFHIGVDDVQCQIVIKITMHLASNIASHHIPFFATIPTKMVCFSI